MYSRAFFETLFLFLFFIFCILISYRDSNFVSDGPNYISHALNYVVDYSLPEFYGYFTYWLIVDTFGMYFGEFFPSFLVFLVFLVLFFSICKLKTLDKFIMIVFIIINPLIFVSLFIALKNGLALSVFLLGISTNSTIISLLSSTLHPGVIPVIIFERLCNIKKINFKILVFLSILLVVLLVFLQKFNFATELLNSRGYSDFEESKEKWYVYFMYFVLAIIYLFSFKKNNYKFLFLLMFLIWLLVGNYYTFAWRLFSQSLVILLYILLLFSDNKKFKFLFLFLFFIISLHSAILWHPLIEYSSGFYDFWIKFF